LAVFEIRLRNDLTDTEVTSDSGVVVASSVAVAEANGRPKSYSASSSRKLHLSSESEREVSDVHSSKYGIIVIVLAQYFILSFP
jgi:hypothetical protein